MTKCNDCPICPFVKEGKTVKSTATKCSVDINRPVNCLTKNILYCITCEKCGLQYIGESERTLRERFSEHKGYVVNNKLTKATGEHFNSKGHKASDMRVTVLEKKFQLRSCSKKGKRKILHQQNEHKIQMFKQDNLILPIAIFF